MICDSKNSIVYLGFELQNLHVIERGGNLLFTANFTAIQRNVR